VISQTIADRVDNVTVFSYDALQDPQYDSSDFYDIDHLRDTGAAHFSRVIYNESMKQLIDLPK